MKTIKDLDTVVKQVRKDGATRLISLPIYKGLSLVTKVQLNTEGGIDLTEHISLKASKKYQS